MFSFRSTIAVLIATAALSPAQTPTFSNPKDLVAAMVERESQPKRSPYEYQVVERGERTGGHLWQEHVVELPGARVYRLLAEDGQPLSPERTAAETSRLQAIAADPAAFAQAQAGEKSDEMHARQMLGLLNKAFILENPRLANGIWRVDFRPDPAYSPSGIEEHVLHGMSGWLTIDATDLRLIHIEGSLPADVNIGFGLLATVHAGSHFLSDREKIDGHWRTVHVVTDIRGKAALFKAIARQGDLTRSQFHYLPAETTIPQAVALVEKP